MLSNPKRPATSPTEERVVGQFTDPLPYVRRLSMRLMEEGVEFCQAYRAAQPKWNPGECAEHEGQLFRVRDIHDGHRARYWPEPGKPTAISIPFGPGYHHTIRRA